MEKVFITECPRDAWQGIKEFIPTEEKVKYLNQLLEVGFDTLDFGSFVSPKAIPQMKDTANVLERLDLGLSNTELLAIVANERGIKDACEFEEIEWLGYPFSVSETFQQRNTNADLNESLKRVAGLSNMAAKKKKKVVLYLSMAFGNPYGDEWSTDIVLKWAEKLTKEFKVDVIALSDTIGSSTPEVLTDVFTNINQAASGVQVSAHLHSTPDKVEEKIKAAYEAGCRRFDGAIKGFGGCPMAKDELTGNMPTEALLSYFDRNDILLNLNRDAFLKASDAFLNVIPQATH